MLKELWLAYNDLTQHDAYNIGLLLKSNLYIQFLDVSNNFIEDSGVQYIIDALIEQSNKLNELNNKNTTAAAVAAALATTAPTPSSPYSCLEDRLRQELSILAAIDRKSSPPPLAATIPQNPTESVEKINENETVKQIVPTSNGGGGGGCVSGRSKLEALLSNSNETSVPTVIMSPLVTIHENQSSNNNEEEREMSTSGVDDDQSTKTSDVTTDIVDNKVVVLGGVVDDDDVFIDSGGGGGGGIGGDSIEVDEKAAAAGAAVGQNVLEIIVEAEEKDKFLKCDNENSIPCTGTKIMPAMLSSSSSTSTTGSSSSEEDVTPTTPEPDINKNTEKAPKLNVIYETGRSMSENSSSCCSSRDELINSSDTDCFDKSTESFDFNDGAGPTPPLTPITIVGSPSMTTSSTQQSITPQSMSQSFDESVFLEKIPCDPVTPTTTTTTSISPTMTTVTTQPTDFSKCDIEVNDDDDTLLTPPVRSVSSDSLNSDTSMDSNDSKSSIKLAEAKFVKNGTLERQAEKVAAEPTELPSHQPTGLQVLIFWNNQITRHSSKSFSDLLAKTNSLEILNVGRNVLSNEFLTNIKQSLKTNTSVTNLGLQGAHLTCPGVKSLSEVIEFGGNSTMQRIDLRDNNIDLTGLTALDEAMKSNKTVTQIDLDETPSKIIVSRTVFKLWEFFSISFFILQVLRKQFIQILFEFKKSNFYYTPVEIF